jgi:hypothetical protein
MSECSQPHAPKVLGKPGWNNKQPNLVTRGDQLPAYQVVRQEPYHIPSSYVSIHLQILRLFQALICW